MPNYDGLYEVSVIYDVTISSRAFEHRHTFDVHEDGSATPGTPPEEVGLVTRQGLDVTLLDFTEDYLPLLYALLGTGTSQPRMELWKYDPEPSVNKTFITAWTSSNTFTLGGTAAVAAHQATYTFRTIAGGVCRMQLMEDRSAGQDRINFNALVTPASTYADFVCGMTSAIVGRDNNHLITGIALNYTQNEKLARKRFRTT